MVRFSSSSSRCFPPSRCSGGAWRWLLLLVSGCVVLASLKDCGCLALPASSSQEQGELEEPEAAASAMASYRALPSTSLDDQLFQLTEKRQAAKYCGKNLANALHLICKGRYNVPLFKKSDPRESPYWLLPPSPLDEEPKFPFRPRSLAAALMPGALRRRTRGVYDECCAKSCSIKEMSSYCGGR